MLLVVGGLSFATLFIINNTGPAPWFEKVAKAFDGDSAYRFTQDLASMDGRGSGQPGAEQAAAYITQKFQKYGIFPGWSHSSYTYPLETRLVRPISQPEMIVLDADGNSTIELRHQLDFGFMTEGHAGSGMAESPLTFVGFTNKPGDYTWETFQGLDLRDRIVILLEGNAPREFITEALIRGARGAIWVTGDGSKNIYSQYQLLNTKGTSLVKPTIPVFRIRPEISQDIFEVAGIRLSNLLNEDIDPSQSGPGWFTKDMNINVHMSLELEKPQSIEIPCIMGYLPGSDYLLANEMVVILANYDGLGVDPDGTVFHGANHNASSISVMLELARLWQEQELDPRRTVLFIAWGGGQFENPGIEEFLADSGSFRYLPATSSSRRRQPYTIFQLDYTGAGADTLNIHPNSNQHLAALLERTGSEVGIKVANQANDLIPNDEVIKVNNAASVHLSWLNGKIPPDEDQFEYIQTDKLQVIGETISLALTKIVRENSY
ncbi:MAG: M28 family peptidase [Anaerolineales bacterium]|nr:M28 family peptidase [Anaerolineales bacterium]